MTDNRTTELCKLLEDCGVEFKTHDIITGKAVTWSGSVCNWVALPDEMGLAVAVYKDYLTPEQAIAATLGSESADYMLTAEQVRRVIEEAKAELLESCEYVGDMSQRQSDVLKAFGKMERAIADELNAELGSGTCSIVKTWSDSDYVDDWRYRCSECGCFIPVNERDPDTGDVINAANYCPNCGRKVVSA